MEDDKIIPQPESVTLEDGTVTNEPFHRSLLRSRKGNRYREVSSILAMISRGGDKDHAIRLLARPSTKRWIEENGLVLPPSSRP